MMLCADNFNAFEPARIRILRGSSSYRNYESFAKATILELHSVQEKPESGGLKKNDITLMRFQISGEESFTQYASLSTLLNSFEDKNEYWPLWSNPAEFNYTTVELDSQTIINPLTNEENKFVLAHIASDLHSEKMIHRRQAYNI